MFPWPLGFFHKGLVIHVVFSFVVWFLAVFGALSLLATDRLASGTLPFQTLGLGAVVGSVLALPMLFIPALLDRGQPTLNNYKKMYAKRTFFFSRLTLLRSYVLTRKYC